VSTEEFDHQGIRSVLRLRAYEAVAAVVADDHNYERGVQQARAVADMVRDQAGADGLAELVVALSLKLAEALEQIAAERGLAAADLADVLFLD